VVDEVCKKARILLRIVAQPSIAKVAQQAVVRKNVSSYELGEAMWRPVKSIVNILPLSSNEISSLGSGF
jgi:hypothetical protein